MKQINEHMSKIGIKNPLVVIFVVAIGTLVSGKLDAIMCVVAGSWMIVGDSVSMSERAGDKLKLLVNFENPGVLPQLVNGSTAAEA